MRNGRRILVGKCEEKRSLGRPGHWKDNVNMNIKAIG
jgi:hypothetical protein